MTRALTVALVASAVALALAAAWIWSDREPRGMSKTHAAVGKLVTEIISAENLDIRLFYVLNNDPTLEELGGADSARPTHYLDLNFLVSAKGGNLWEVKLADICLYSDLVPAAGAVCEDVNGVRTRMLRYEFYFGV